jgi:hypothetical protein
VDEAAYSAYLAAAAEEEEEEEEEEVGSVRSTSGLQSKYSIVSIA